MATFSSLSIAAVENLTARSHVCHEDYGRQRKQIAAGKERRRSALLAQSSNGRSVGEVMGRVESTQNGGLDGIRVEVRAA